MILTGSKARRGAVGSAGCVATSVDRDLACVGEAEGARSGSPELLSGRELAMQLNLRLVEADNVETSVFRDKAMPYRSARVRKLIISIAIAWAAGSHCWTAVGYAQGFIGLPPDPGGVGDIRRGPDGRIEPVRPIQPAPDRRSSGSPRGRPSPPQASPNGRRAVDAPPPPAAPVAPVVPAPPEESATVTESLPGWIVDARNRCRIWNPNPRPNERAEWTGRCDGGLASGAGVLSWLENEQPTERYEGEYHDGQQNGRGVYSWANGDRYDGEWREGEQSGRGVLVWASGDRYEGEWVDGKRTGQGTLAWQNGERYEGGWRNGVPEGDGVLTTARGTYSGVWTNGCMRDGNRRAAIGVPLNECP
jgi:hypothetical protein